MSCSSRLIPFRNSLERRIYSSMLRCGMRSKVLLFNKYPLVRHISSSSRLFKKSEVTVTFVSQGQKLTLTGTEGQSLLDILEKSGKKFKGYGACEGTLSCSTCHVLFNVEDFNKLPKATVEEKDVLDLAFEITPVSRLGCQVFLSKDMDGMEIKVPDVIRDIRGDSEEQSDVVAA